MSSQFCTPCTRWAAPGSIRDDGSFDAAPSQPLQHRPRIRIDSRHSEDRLHESCAKFGERGIVQRSLRVEQFTQAIVERAHGKVRAFVVQADGSLEQLLFIAGPPPYFPAMA